MRKYFAGLLALGLGLLVSSNVMPYVGPYVPGAGINGTAHDLSPGGDIDLAGYVSSTDTDARICIFCHSPHNTYKLSSANLGPGAGIGGGPQAPDDFDYLPLWNHELTGNAGSYSMYWNGPGAPTVGAKASQAILNGLNQPGGVSLLCLSCHDGSISVNSYGNPSQPASSQSGGSSTIGAEYVIGKDNYLGNHHPIGFNYDDADLPDTEIKPADGTPMGSAGDVRSHLYGSGNTQMECATCHAVHNKGNTGDKSLLWRKDENSRLCLTCHDKGTDPGATP